MKIDEFLRLTSLILSLILNACLSRFCPSSSDIFCARNSAMILPETSAIISFLSFASLVEFPHSVRNDNAVSTSDRMVSSRMPRYAHL